MAYKYLVMQLQEQKIGPRAGQGSYMAGQHGYKPPVIISSEDGYAPTRYGREESGCKVPCGVNRIAAVVTKAYAQAKNRTSCDKWKN